MYEQSKILEGIKSEIETLEDDLKQAKIEYADIELSPNNWNNKTDRKVKCKVLEGKIEVLWKMEKFVQSLFTQTLSKV